MKILKLKNSTLFLRIDTDKDSVKCVFMFFVSWCNFKFEEQTFDLNVLNVAQVKEFYKIAADEYSAKYRID